MTGLRPIRPVLMIVHGDVDEDARVRRQAASLAAAGRPVTIIGLGGRREAPAGHLVAAIRGAWNALRLHRRERFGLVQVHAMPDVRIAAALPLRLLGVPVVLDLHETMPASFRSRPPGAARGGWPDRLRHWQGRASIWLATRTLTANDCLRERLLRLGFDPDRVTVVPDGPSLARFDVALLPNRPFRADGRLRLVDVGGLTPIREVEVAIRAVARLAAMRPDLDVAFDVHGRGDGEPMLRALAAELGVADRVTFHGRIGIDDVPPTVAAADVGLALTHLDESTALTMPTQIHAYAAMDKPVVATRLPMVGRTFPPGSVATYESGDVEALAAALAALADDPARRDRAVRETARVARATAWERVAPAYVALIDDLAADGPEPLAQATPSRR